MDEQTFYVQLTSTVHETDIVQVNLYVEKPNEKSKQQVKCGNENLTVKGFTVQQVVEKSCQF